MPHDLSISQRQRLVRVARGLEAADLVVRGATLALVQTGELLEADLSIAEGRFAAIGAPGSLRGLEVVDAAGAVLAPGLIDGHIHIESSMLTPARFAEAVLPRGTTTVVAEPHELVNVLGLEGLRWTLTAGADSGMRVFASQPSCVPASPFERGGAKLSAADAAEGLRVPGVLGLAEMMNYPGVLNADANVWDTLEAGRGGRIDGHAAGLSGADLQAYAAAGIHSDHEAVTLEQGRDRLRAGLWLMVREGSAARNLGALLPLLRERPRRAMLVSDDVEVLELLELGHLDRLLRQCVSGGLDPLYALSLVTQNPAEYWGLHDLGLVAPGYHADFVLFENLTDFAVRATYVAGRPAHGGGRTPALARGGVLLGSGWEGASLEVPAQHPVIGVQDRQIETLRLPAGTPDTVKLVALERHGDTVAVAAAWAAGIGLRRGAIGTTVQHDAHNLLVAGTDDRDILLCARAIEAMGGGIAVVDGGEVVARLPLEVAGLMSDRAPQEVARLQREVEAVARALGCTLPHPLTTLSFLGLTVIPALKLTPDGLFDVEAFTRIKT
ncbi:adenine deaminase [Deinobacterium chartae]|uniref:Adenine deaminase n=1 Tax=Deinobacterium chartae TaxID=521158 RepID=A0A841HYM5_9DEIO|nr:adenine deaminase C-terminal domain-containing protein [Deinobacterium chartae]MBB6097764.1 adenine deaminase [Deinobacterium chartae]